MNNSIITAVFCHDRRAKTREVYQWDYGMTLRFRGAALPEYYTVHFSNQPMSGTAKKQVGDANGVAVPDEYLTTGQPVYAWIFLHDGVADGESVYMATIPVRQRPQPTEEEPAPAQQGVIEEAIAALNAGVEEVHGAIESVQQTVDDALRVAKESGEFDGPQGSQGEQGIPGPKGEKGDPGDVSHGEFDTLKQYVADMSPIAVIGPAPAVSVTDAAPLDAGNLIISIEPAQAGSGEPSPDNVRPISGWTGAKVTKCGKNLLPVFAKNRTVNGVTFSVNNDGSVTVSGKLTASNAYSPSVSESDMVSNGAVKLPGGIYTLSGGEISAAIYLYVLNSDSSRLRRYQNTGGENNIIIADGEYVFYRIIRSSNDDEDTKTVYPMLRYAENTDSSYEPYQGSTYDITFPSNAGTVYGGTLDVVNGVLTVDRAMVDLGTLTWTLSSDRAKCILSDAVDPPHSSVIPSNLVFSGMTLVSAKTSLTEYGQISYLNASGSNTLIAFYNGVLPSGQLVYELSTPITYQLTPQAVALLRGGNAIFADTGDTTLSYRQDVGLLLEALTRPDETDMVADKNYAANSFFTIGGTLYRATAAIAAGETIQPGVNCAATTLADQLTDIYALL